MTVSSSPAESEHVPGKGEPTAGFDEKDAWNVCVQARQKKRQVKGAVFVVRAAQREDSTERKRRRGGGGERPNDLRFTDVGTVRNNERTNRVSSYAAITGANT